MNRPAPLVPFRRRLLLLQSWRQAFHVLVILLAINLIVDTVFPFPSMWVAVGAFVGVAAYLWRGFPSVLDVRYAEIPLAFEKTEHLLRRDFRKIYDAEDASTYRENRPEFLTWREGQVTIAKRADGIWVSGPGLTLAWLRRRLEKLKDKQCKETWQNI
jgi:hypothetical protein